MVIPAFALALPGNTSITNTLTTELHTDNKNGNSTDDDYGLILNRLNVTGSNAGDFGSLTHQFRIDAARFFDAPTEDFENFGRLERLSFRYQKDSWKLTVGDYFRQLGKGIVLSIRKMDEAGLDYALRGAQAAYSGDNLDLSIFGGYGNSANLDPVSQHFIDDHHVFASEDLLTGASLETRIYSGLSWGIYGLFNQPKKDPNISVRNQSTSAGSFLDFRNSADTLSIYVEGDWQQRKEFGISKDATAAYLLSTAYLGDYTLIAEALFMDDFLQQGSTNSALSRPYAYNQPPTLERFDQEVLNNRNVQGGRLRIERSFFEPDLILYANFMHRSTDAGEPAEIRQLHGYAGFELGMFEDNGRLMAAAGYRDERTPDGDPVKSMSHWEVDYTHFLGGGYSVHTASLNEHRKRPIQGGGDLNYTRGSTYLEFDKSALGSLGMELGYDSEKDEEGIANTFLAGFMKWEITGQIHMRAVGGTQRGGIKCVGGVCREYPGFAGGRLELIGSL